MRFSRLQTLAAAAVAVGAVAESERATAQVGGTSTDVVETVRAAKAYTEPARSSRHERGLVMRGARFAVRDRKKGKGCRGDWLRIDERAWLCSRATRATDSPPGGRVRPALKEGRTLPFTYVVTRDAKAYESLEDAAAETNARALPGLGGFKYRGRRRTGGLRYVKTDVGWIPAEQAKVVSSVEFHGVRLEPGDAGKRLAFVTAKRARLYDASGARVAAPPLPRQRYLGEVGPPVVAGKVTLHRVADGRYVRQKDIGLIERAEPPQVGDDERWIDVQLSQQTLVAYEGRRPVMATLVSTARTTTPTGVFPIAKKRPYSRMKSKPYYRRKWDVHAPWVMTLKGRIAMHAIYWHDGFGQPGSMGCINLSPRDAKWIWDWTYPELPPGWTRIETRDGTRATLVRVRK